MKCLAMLADVYEPWRVREWISWGGNLALVLVGIAGIVVAVFTLLRIHRQAKEMQLQRIVMHQTLNVMRQQVDLMKAQTAIQTAGMRQWVDVVPRGASVFSRAWNPPVGDPFEVQLQFEVINNTSYVMTIEKIVTKISMDALEWETFTVETNVTLSHNKGSPSNRYPFYVASTTIKEQRYESGTVVTINGEVTFKNCFGEKQVDYFGGIYECGPGVFRCLKPLGLVPERQMEKNEPESEIGHHPQLISLDTPNPNE
jgi:hypothetical protein